MADEIFGIVMGGVIVPGLLVAGAMWLATRPTAPSDRKRLNKRECAVARVKARHHASRAMKLTRRVRS